MVLCGYRAVKNTGRKRGGLAQFRPQDARRPRGCEGGGRRLEPSPCWGSAAPGPLLGAVTSPPGVTHGSGTPHPFSNSVSIHFKGSRVTPMYKQGVHCTKKKKNLTGQFPKSR